MDNASGENQVMTNIILIAIYWLIVLSIVLVIIAENRKPLKALPWILVIVLVPVLGIVLYIFFGEDLRHTYIMHKKVYSRIANAPSIFQDRLLLEQPKEGYSTPLRKLVKATGNSALLSFSDLCIFTNGPDKFKVLLEDLAKAKHHIHIQYYAFANDEIGNKIANVLIERALQGVRVRIIYDDVGSWSTKRHFWKRLRKAGIEVHPFMKVVFPFLSSRVNYRNHRKVVVIDGTVGYIGGMNIADRYYKGNELGVWRDTHFRIKGNGLYLLQSSFLLDWNVVSRRVVNMGEYFPLLPKTEASETLPLMQVIAGAPIGEWRTIEQAIISLFLRARSSITIETPYFLPTNTLLDAITLAALSGIEVRLIIPGKSDVQYVQTAALSYLSELLEAGVKVYFYKGGFLHSKFITIDGEIAFAGSANLDFRSLEHNFEIVSIFYDRKTTSKLEAIFEQDIALSEPVDPKRWEKRPRLQRFIESVMRLFSPLL